MACIIRDAGYDKIVVITGIGKWMGSITPRLIKEVKQIGGPDLNRLVSVDGVDNSMADHAFVLIGRRGLCRYNGIFRVRNYDITRELKQFFPDISSDPNDCYFEKIDFENEKNKHSENQFFHLVDLRLNLNLNNDNRFSYMTPTITSVSPLKGPITGNQYIRIHGFSFGSSTLDIKEVLIRGVACRDVQLINPNIITCTTRPSSIMGAGVGNVIIKLLCGLSSPTNTCNMYQYSNEVTSIESSSSESTTSVSDILPYPSMPVIGIDSSPLLHEIPSGSSMMIQSTHVARPNHIPIFAFKQKDQKKYDTKGYPKMNDIMSNLNNKLYNGYDNKDLSNNHVEKIDNLVTDNYKNLINHANTNGFDSHKDGFRKRRFQKVVSQLGR